MMRPALALPPVPRCRAGLLLFMALLPLLSGCEMLLRPVVFASTGTEYLFRKGTIDLQGEVVDDRGQPVDGVTVRITKGRIARPVSGLFEQIPQETQTEQRTVSHRFAFHLHGWQYASLFFEKPGYYQDLIRVESGRRALDDRRFLSPAVAAQLGDPKFLRYRSLRIVLERERQRTQLILYRNVKLTYGEGTSHKGGRVIDLDQPPNPTDGKSGRLAADLTDATQLPRCGAYMLASTEDGAPGGEVDWFQIRTDGSSWPSPKQLRLRLTGEGAGWIPLQSHREVNVLWGMKTAPVNGYQPELVLDQEFMRDASTSGGISLYFYFRTCGRYGKGQIHIPMMDRDKAALEADFLIQPDGSRNVESRQY